MPPTWMPMEVEIGKSAQDIGRDEHTPFAHSTLDLSERFVGIELVDHGLFTQQLAHQYNVIRRHAYQPSNGGTDVSQNCIPC